MTDIILRLGGLQAFVLGIFLFTRKNSPRANYYLAALIMLVGVASLLYSTNNVSFLVEHPYFIRIDWGLPLLFGPLLFFYTQALTNHEFSTSKTDLLHSLPYIINVVILLPFLAKSGEEKIQILNYFTASISTGTDQYFFYSIALRLLIGVSGIYYTTQCLGILKSFEESLLEEYSEIVKLRLEWLKLLIYSFLFLFLIFIITLILSVTDRYASFDHQLYFYIVLFLIAYLLSYKTLGQSKVIQSQHLKSSAQFHTSTSKISRGADPELKKLANDLVNYVEREKPYLRGELTGSELANAVDISRHQLSEVLNRELNEKFYDFINKYRVSTFKEKLADPSNKNITLLGLALDSGFNSKASFNSTFKRLTGLTPRQYKDSLS